MPFETFVIEPGSSVSLGDRTHEMVAKDITKTFENIKQRGGQFVTAIELADHVTYAGQGGEPNGATYIVAEFPESSS